MTKKLTTRRTDAGVGAAALGLDNPAQILAGRFNHLPALFHRDHEAIVSACLCQIGNVIAEHPEMLTSSGDDDDFWPEGDGDAYGKPYVVKQGVLSIPVQGVLLNNFDYQIGSYATGYQYIQAAYDRGMADPNVKRIALKVDSPGGMAAGNFELVEHMVATKAKPVETFVTGSAYSGGYSIATVGDKINAAPSAGVGSIGVVMSHLDISKMAEQEGVKMTFIFAGDHKVDGNMWEPLPDAVKTKFQKSVDATYDVFASTVATNRNMAVKDVKATEADIFTAKEGLAKGLVDNVGAFKTQMAAFKGGDQGVSSMSDVKQADHEAAVKKSGDDGRKAERERIQAIMSCDEAKSRPTLAAELAYGEDVLSLESAKRILAKSPVEKTETQQQQDRNQQAFENAVGAGAPGVRSQDPNAGDAGKGRKDPKDMTAEENAAAIVGDYRAAGGGNLKPQK